MTRRMVFSATVLAIVLLMACPQPFAVREVAKSAPVTGAIFTTLADGSRVNANIYENKEAVHLDGGPGDNAPITAAGLPDGWYYFQVTDPSGKVLLSQDPVKCRSFLVESGIIVAVANESYLVKIRGQWVQADCTHLTGLDIDHGALTVQLMPYKNTPNRGGVYKVWATPVDDFEGNPEQIDNPGQFHGFVPSKSKTDNFKVRKGKPYEPPTIKVRKFSDLNFNGVVDPEDPEIGVDVLIDGGGWPAWVVDPLGTGNSGYTPWTFTAMPGGIWTVGEDDLAHWLATGAYVDGVAVDGPPFSPVLVSVGESSGETHEVIFLNGEAGDITACKRYDPQGDQTGETPVADWQFCLTGTDILGGVVSDCKTTGEDGCAAWGDLIPGNYTVTEVMAQGSWQATGEENQSVELHSGEEVELIFHNFCTADALMHTKGFWQNQGCTIVNADDLAYLNSLPPYAGGAYNTNGQDNCGGVACPNLTGLPFDSVNELGCYIVAPNSQDEGIGLAQQLAAFILNVRHWMDSADSVLVLPGGNLSAQDIIDAAVLAWVTGNDVSYWQSFLDGLNNAGTLEYISSSPCDVSY